MNTIPLVAAIAGSCVLILALAPRHGDPKTRGLMPLIIAGMFRWARFCWSLAVGVEAGYHRYRAVRAEMASQVEVRP